MKLTDWWNALITDLDRLKSLVKPETANSEPWKAAMEMATQGKEIESNLLAARGRETAIKNESKKLGSEFNSGATRVPQYLPDVNNPDELLFAMVYYQHLSRYVQINEGNSLVLTGVRDNDSVVQANMPELKRRIEDYCRKEADAVIGAFPDIAQQEGADLFEKVQNFLSELPLVDKLVGQFEEEAKKKIDEYDQRNVEYNQTNIAGLFTALDSVLKEKEKILRKIAEYKKFIEELTEGDSLLAVLKDDTNQLEQKFPRIAGELKSLDTPDTERGMGAKIGISTARGLIAVGEKTGEWASYLIGNTLGRIAPQRLNDLGATIVSTIGGIKEAVKPVSNTESKKQALIAKAQKQIGVLADGLNFGEDRKLKVSGKDFEKLSSAQVSEMADKIGAIRYIVHIQKCLALYEQKQAATGVARITQVGILKPIINWLTETPFRRVMHDKILLIREAEKLEQELEALKEKLDKTPSYKQDQLDDELNKALQKTATKAQKIHSNSIYTLFSHDIKKESEEAAKDLKAVTDTAMRTRGL
ncbi:hypothetical protein [Legionella micdadei]|uniref:Uncharacterized protein n=1 Tax=Legionella micdadei TaxID=451 RepID=A0A098GG51_LEGMI|nr:hypothetical protein [Legionella micdadei]ARG97922.1 hypothetical protein B6N58_09770 [Legionella micdadei]ARG99757.1 hypothetical protein B6V88_04635 [Legionella micdadei]KTD28646.1 hypothetical protein Lmic_1757 [Legionella micdadei]NSL19301.1 hypothetical protein [Legionella micdadei]CEG60461.1 protein of unknown function [coiled-coil domains] [Legionella micdadei]